MPTGDPDWGAVQGAADAAAVYCILAWQALSYPGGVYIVAFAVPAAFIPWLLVALDRDGEPPGWGEALMMCLGLSGGVCDIVRSNTATAVFVGASVMVRWAPCQRVRKIGLVASMILGMALVLVSLSVVYAVRDTFLASARPGYSYGGTAMSSGHESTNVSGTPTTHTCRRIRTPCLSPR
jgi:hypothetical protein